MSRDLTYFISDLHLGASYIESPREHERRVVDFLRSIAPRARRLVLLGDVLDYWWEYTTVVPRGYTRFVGALAELADSGVELHWLKGNHDIWIFDYLPNEIGFTLHDGIMTAEWDGRRFLLEHGDGVGRLPTSFRILRRLFRNRFAQWLYSFLPPRLTIGFAHGWSSHSRRKGGQMKLPADQADNPLVEWAEEYNMTHRQAKVDYFVFGHQHILLDRELQDGGRVIVLGDWIDKFSYGVWDGTSFSLKKFDESGESTSC